jgi:hypothetical protein
MLLVHIKLFYNLLKMPALYNRVLGLKKQCFEKFGASPESCSKLLFFKIAKKAATVDDEECTAAGCKLRQYGHDECV